MDAPPSYRGVRYSEEIIAHAVRLFFRFPLSFREVEELFFERGITVTYETVRQWCAKCGQTYPNGLYRRRPRLGDKWHMDEVFLKIKGTIHYLWRAVDQDGSVLDILVTDKLRSYGAAHREAMPSVERRCSTYLNDRCENSHQPTRQRERAMKRFTSAGHAQRFLSTFSGISPHFCPRRHLLTAHTYRHESAQLRQ
ncbi:transposase [Streptomyces chattanoogensis]|uniref:Transposase n=1 Tax=Streptomyces chattanoogensis TaxID=66876 RepID=A0A0N0H1A3_9ACTN|nr:transposase [Streptomyces chattanoogensis]